MVVRDSWPLIFSSTVPFSIPKPRVMHRNRFVSRMLKLLLYCRVHRYSLQRMRWCIPQMVFAYFFSAANSEEEDISGPSATPPGSPASSQESPAATWDDVITRPALAMRQFRQPVNLDEKLYQPSTVPRRFKSIGMNDGILKRCFF